MATRYFLHFGKTPHGEPPAFDRLALNDVNILSKWVFAQNAKHKWPIVISENVLRPLSIFGKLIEIKGPMLVRREGTGLRVHLAGQRGNGAERQRKSGKPFENVAAPQRHGGSAAHCAGLY